MKVILVISLILVSLYFVNGEITPRFPGLQPILVVSDPDSYYTEIEDKSVIDNFSFTTLPVVIVALESNAPPAVQNEGYDRDDGILGGERDIIATIESGNTGADLTAGASGDVFVCSTGVINVRATVKLQYDGIDGSPTLSTNPGLNGFDLTDGNAIGFRLLASSDTDTVFFVTIVDTLGRSATIQGDVLAGPLFSYFVDYDTFLSTIDFTSVAAIEIEVEIQDNVDVEISEFVTYGAVSFFGDCFSGTVLPCDMDYYRIETLTNVNVGDYLKFVFNTTGETSHPDSTAVFYISSSPFTDLQSELASNNIIFDTLGDLPGRNNYIYRCDTDCAIEIVWSALQETTYYLGVEGRGDGLSQYTICHSYNNVPVFQLFDQVPQPVFFDQRVDYPPEDRVINYRYYVIDVPDVRFSPGTYLTVNVSRVAPFPGTTMRIMYESLPETAEDTGILDSIDFNNEGARVDDMIFPFCIDYSARPEGSPQYIHPVRTDRRIPCECTSDILFFGEGPFFQLTCQLYIDPCRFRYGNYYVSLELPERAEPYNTLDTTGRLNYTITARVVQPVINEILRNETLKGFLEPELMLHFFVDVLPSEVIEGETHFFVHVSNVRNAFIDVYVHQGLGGTSNSLAGGPEACVPANATCHTCDACNIVIEKCHFVPGTWYISVAVSYDQEEGEFEIFDFDRLPVTFTIRTDWLEDSAPQQLIAGVPVSKYIGAALYDFYVINVPATIDTWLYVELYTQACDTEVILAILHGQLPGGECYARPDFYCITGDPKEKVWTTGPPTFFVDEPVQRESCSFMIQTCELQAGPLYISVYGHHTGYAAYGDDTFYQVPVHYTLWADFDVALALTSHVSYSETVFEEQYQHYYIRADQVEQGSWLSVEITNIRHAIPQTIEAFVNYNYLAGNCPCYDHLYNCTGSAPCSSVQQVGGIPHLTPDWEETVLTCCTIVVPASDFRPGVWYVSVLGVNEDYYQYTTPIGYTLTVTIHDAPSFHPLILGQTFSGVVPQWNETLEYAQFRLGAEALPLQDLVIKVTFVQNCEFLGKHDDKRDSVWLFVNKGSPATAIGWDYHCLANIPGDSYCTIVIPHCEWSGDDYFISVQGDYHATFTGRFTLRAFTDEVRDIPLIDGVPYYDRVSEGRYKHYYIHTDAEESQYLNINIYTNSDQDAITAYLQKDTRAGTEPCFTSFAECHTKSCCTWQLLACELEPGRYYISVFGSDSQFYETSVEFTLTATHTQVSTKILNNEPLTGHLYNVGDVHHYAIEIVNLVDDGEYLLFSVDNVKHGSVIVYGQHNSLAGRCPCYTYRYSCEVDPLFDDITYCDIRIPTCELQLGTYFFSVWATEIESPAPIIYDTPIGYVVEASIITSRIVRPIVQVGRNSANTEFSERIFNDRYIHYEFSFTEADYLAGYHVVVEITQVEDATLNVYYNTAPSDIDCHIAQICTSGLSSGGECRWQLPFSLVRPSAGPHYITVGAITGRQVANYNLLIFKQAAPTILGNPGFSLDDDDDTFELTSFSFPVGSELNVTHVDRQEPNGWTQFFILSDASHTDSDRGDMLEIFFYRITNNPGEALDFNVYIYPEVPAGAHECCGEDPVELGSCQGAPTLNTADTTVAINNGADVITHTCSFTTVGTGNGPSNESPDPFYGERCTVRVWPCEFHKYCNRTLDWFASVVPIIPTNPTSIGPGLQYSVQWRSRNIRLADSTGATTTSVDLTPIINTYEFEPVSGPHVIPTTSTENQGWASYYVDWTSAYGRLSIQTEFLAGDGEVFIHRDTFASEGNFYTCWDYRCSSADGNCGSDGRFIITEACSSYDKAPSRYWITVRNNGNDDADDVEVQFRIYSIELPAAVVIPKHPTEEAPYVNFSGATVFTGVTGVEGDNYNFYEMTIDDHDLVENQQWIIEVTYDDDDNSSNPSIAGDLEVYIRYGAEPGLYGVNSFQSYYENAPEAAHTYEYICQLAAVDDVCTFQIPSCALRKGFWYIAIRNPTFQLDGIPTDLPDYTIVTYVTDPPVNFAIDEQLISTTLTNLGYLQHFQFDLTTDFVDYDNRDDLSGSYWTNYLRIQIDNILDETGLGLGSIEYWVNFGFLAGDNTEYLCYGNIHNDVCSNTACFYDVLPCADFYSTDNFLHTGTYFISVRQIVPSTYTVLARVYFNEYQAIPVTQTITGTGHRAGTTDELYRISPGDAELTALGDGSGNFRYVIDPTAGGDDDIPDLQYFTVNITASDDTFWDAGDELHLEVWRDDCTKWHCDLDGPDSWCTIDALDLAPCTAKAGRFFFKVVNPEGLPFTLDVYRNESTVQRILDHQIITEIVYPYEYQQYFYEAVDVGEGATLTVDVCSICGDVEVYIRKDLPAGPTDLTSYCPDGCSIDYCTASGPKDTTFEEENNCCTLFIDVDQYDQRGYYIGVRGVAMTYPDETNSHLYLPAKYEIEVRQTTVNFTSLSFNCPYIINYIDSWNEVPRQYYVDLETTSQTDVLQFTLRVPVESDLGALSSLYVSIDGPVRFSQLSQTISCEVDSSLIGGDYHQCHITLSCLSIGRYYIFPDAPRGSEIFVDRYETFTPIIYTDLTYHGSVAAPTDVDIEFSETYHNALQVQVYRFDINPHGDENYYEKFYIRIHFDNIANGELRAGWTLASDGQICSAFNRNFVFDTISNGDYLEITAEDIPNYFDHNSPIYPVYLFVQGSFQSCELHAVTYEFIVKTHWEVTYLNVDTTICEHVPAESINFHRLRPRQTEYPQQSVLQIDVVDADNFGTLIVSDGLMKPLSFDFFPPDEYFAFDFIDDLHYTRICAYDDLYISTQNDEFLSLNARLTVTKVKVPVKELYEDSIYYADDDDDDACPHPHDYYIFKTAQPLGHHRGSFLRVLVDSLFSTEVYVNKGSFAWDSCNVASGFNTPDETGTTSVNVYDFDFSDGVYFVTVVSDGPYYIYTDIRDDAIPLTLGEVFRDSLEPGQYQVYSIEICHDWLRPDDRLVVDIADVENADVYGAIQRDSLPTPFSFFTNLGESTAFYGPDGVGTGFAQVVVHHSQLLPGTYYLLIQALYPEDRNCQDVFFRLFPHLLNYEIEPVEIHPNTVITDAIDVYFVNRIAPTATQYANYYVFMALMEDEGYFEGTSFATVSLSNIQGGRVSVVVLRSRLAIGDYAYFSGESEALPASSVTYGRRPHVSQLVANFNSFTGCPGGGELCASNFDCESHVDIFLSSCYLTWEWIYIAVGPAIDNDPPFSQVYRDQFITYDLSVEQHRDYILLQPNTNHLGAFAAGDLGHDYYYSISAEPEAMRWRVVVTSGESVVVNVRDHRCPFQTSILETVTCSASDFEEDRNFVCEIEIANRYEHNYRLNYFIEVLGTNATYSIAFWRGRENCHQFTGSGRNEGLDFCAGLVPYSTWRWDDYSNLDHTARCRFEQLYSEFRVQPCWSGVSPECNSTLQAFACYETFHRCDAQGFQVGTCRDACEAVEYECVNRFESVNLERYECSSHRYIDGRAQVCTGGDDFSSFDFEHEVFLGDVPNVILFKSSSEAGASTLVTPLCFIFVLIVALFV